MKKVLLVFDKYINTEILSKRLYSFELEDITMMPLTSEWGLIEKVERTCHLTKQKLKEILILDSAKLVNDEVDKIRMKIPEWAAEIGNYEIDGKTLKDWFLNPNKEVSTWWFSLVSEKNTLKTDVFFRIAQIQAIDKIVSSGSFDLFVFSINEENFAIALKMLCDRLAIIKLHIPSFKLKKIFKFGINLYFKKKSIYNFFLKPLFSLSTLIFRAIGAKLTMGPLKNRLKSFNTSVIFVSYFPLIDTVAAGRGILNNKYAPFIQRKISDMGKTIIWIWMYVFLDGHSYIDALKLAKKFGKNGETSFFLEEFLSVKTFFSIFYSRVFQVKTYLKIIKLIPDYILYKNLSIPESAIFIKSLMNESFIGSTGLEGIYYFELYKRIFSTFSNVSHCIYYAEMQGWEKSLNAAKDLKNAKIKTVGFQHTNVSRNYFHYFHHNTEMKDKTSHSRLPLPDVLACCGEIPCELLKKQGYSNLIEVEAIRQFYLIDHLKNYKSVNKKEQILLVAGSYDAEETSLLLALLYAAFRENHSFKIWIKAHPSTPVFRILDSLNIDYKENGYEIKNDNIDMLLKDATMVLAGFSNVGLEALAFNCRVFIPIFSDKMHINPLVGFEELYTKIYNPRDLNENIKRSINYNGKEGDFNIKRDFISKYWCLDKTLKRWEAVLK